MSQGGSAVHVAVYDGEVPCSGECEFNSDGTGCTSGTENDKLLPFGGQDGFKGAKKSNAVGVLAKEVAVTCDDTVYGADDFSGSAKSVEMLDDGDFVGDAAVEPAKAHCAGATNRLCKIGCGHLHVDVSPWQVVVCESRFHHDSRGIACGALGHGAGEMVKERCGIAHRCRSLLEACVILAVRLAVQAGGNENRGRNGFPFGMSDDGIDRFRAHLLGKLNRVGVDFSLLDGLFALGLSVETDDEDFLCAPCFFEGGSGSEGRWIIDGEDGLEVRMRLEDVFGGFESEVFCAATFEFAHDVDAGFTCGVVRINDLAEPFDAELTRLDLLEVQDCDSAAIRAEGFNHGLGRLFASAEVVGGDLRQDFHPRFAARNVDGDDGDSGGICLLDDGNNRF